MTLINKKCTWKCDLCESEAQSSEAKYMPVGWWRYNLLKNKLKEEYSPNRFGEVGPHQLYSTWDYTLDVCPKCNPDTSRVTTGNFFKDIFKKLFWKKQ